MRGILLGILICGVVQADIVKVTASAIVGDTDGSVFNGTSYKLSTQLDPFDPSLGTLTSVDLTIAAITQTGFTYDGSNFVGPFPYPGTITFVSTGNSSFTGTQSVTQTFGVDITSPGCGPLCTAISTLVFGGEETLTDGTSLSQFEGGHPVPLVASASVLTFGSPGVTCCATAPLLEVALQPSGRPTTVYGYLSLDATATYTYTTAPEPQTTPWILGMFFVAALTMRRRGSRLGV
jgi:hypothetical protein